MALEVPTININVEFFSGIHSLMWTRCRYTQISNIFCRFICSIKMQIQSVCKYWHKNHPNRTKIIKTNSHTLIIFLFYWLAADISLWSNFYVHLIFAIRPIYHPNKLNSVPLSSSQTQFKYIRNKIQSPLVWVINLWIQLKWL